MSKTIRNDDVPMDTYLAHDALGSHSLSLFADLGPRMFVMRRGKMVDEERGEALRFGAMFEDIVQGRPLKMDSCVVKPVGMSFSSAEGKVWRNDQVGRIVKNDDEFQAALSAIGKELIAQEDLDAMRWMHDSFMENETAVDMVKHARKQVSFFGDPKDEGPYGTKSRPDWLVTDNLSADLKTTASLKMITSAKQVRDLRYYVQAAIARRLMFRHLSEQGARSPNTEHVLLAVEKKMPYRCQIVVVSPDWLAAGDRFITDTLAQIDDCVRSGFWPRVTSDSIELPPPPSWL